MNNNINEILLSDDFLQNLKIPKECGYYVYGLIDPDDIKSSKAEDSLALPFYIGKGSGNRLYVHFKQARKLLSKRADIMEELKTNIDVQDMSKDLQLVLSKRIQKIWDIIDRKKTPIYVIYRWGLTEKEAYKIEATLIDIFPNLTNIQAGHDSYHGMTTPKDLQNILKIKEYKKLVDSTGQETSYMIIKLKNNIAQRGSDSYADNLYKAVRGCWYVNIERASRYQYVLAVVNGVVKGVYEVDNWHVSETEAPRKEFDGKPTTNETMRKLIGHLIPKKYRKQGMANPIIYVN